MTRLCYSLEYEQHDHTIPDFADHDDLFRASRFFRMYDILGFCRIKYGLNELR